MGQIFCPTEQVLIDKNDRPSGTEREDGKASRPQQVVVPPPASWDLVDANSCDVDILVIAAIQAFAPAGLRRYLVRRQQLNGARCFEYTSTEDGGFSISVTSHAMTIASDVSKWSDLVASSGVEEANLVMVRAIGIGKLAKVEAGDGDRSKLRCVAVADLPED
eukprot:TRINITY_DN11907_c0_g1_i1.p1 TRINITY_DN11907_c0_g1~~TRINITY_DN11907_c0_g1_i1.p1  ORF type:complete len:163 (-),score=32.57 TRINITY_DN11907_c0_g1_i1:157-645(-)